MTRSIQIPASSRLDRPAGYFPRRTSLALIGLAGLATCVPLIGLACASPFIVGGFDLWLASVPYVVGFGAVTLLGTFYSMATHRYWSVCLFFYAGCTALFAYLLVLLCAVAALAGVFTVRDPEIRVVMPVIGLIELLFIGGPSAWLLQRALRLRYWQPGTTPDMWEPGDEGPPAWSPFRRR